MVWGRMSELVVEMQFGVLILVGCSQDLGFLVVDRGLSMVGLEDGDQDQEDQEDQNLSRNQEEPLVC